MAYTIGTHLQVIAAQYEQVRVVPLTDTTAVLVYKNGVASVSVGSVSSVFARVATLDGLDITLGPEYNLSTLWSRTCANVGACKVTDGKFAVALFGSSSAVWHGWLGIASVVGTTISVGSLTPDLHPYGVGIPRLEQLEDDKFIISYIKSGGGESKPAFRVGTVAGTTITLGAHKEVYSRNSDAMDMVVLSPTNAVMIFRQTKWSTNETWCSAVTIAGTVVSTGTRRQVAPANLGVENTAIAKLDSTHVGIFYRDNNNSNFGTCHVATITGAGVSVKAAEVFESGTIDNPVGITNPRTSGTLGGYLSASNQAIIRDAVRSGDNTIWDDEVVLHEGGTSYLSIGHMTDTVGIGMYTDTGDGDVKVVAFATALAVNPSVSSGNLFIQGHINANDNTSLFMSGSNLSIALTHDLFIQGHGEINNSPSGASLFIKSSATIQTSGDLFLLAPAIGIQNSTTNIFINGVEPKPSTACPPLDPTASIQLKPSLITIYQSRIDALINQLGVNVHLEFDPIRNPCPNCTFDNMRKRSTGIYVPGGPRPFSRGRTCPWCKGRGFEETSVKKCIKCLAKWNPKDAANFGISVSNRKGIVRLKTFLTEADDLIRANTVLAEVDIANELKLRVKLIKDPIPVGLREDRYCISFWELL